RREVVGVGVHASPHGAAQPACLVDVIVEERTAHGVQREEHQEKNHEKPKASPCSKYVYGDEQDQAKFCKILHARHHDPRELGHRVADHSPYEEADRANDQRRYPSLFSLEQQSSDTEEHRCRSDRRTITCHRPYVGDESHKCRRPLEVGEDRLRRLFLIASSSRDKRPRTSCPRKLCGKRRAHAAGLLTRRSYNDSSDASTRSSLNSLR